MNHATATANLARGRNGTKKIANNTYLVPLEDGAVAVRLHDTNVLTILPDNSYILNSGGWQTVTTKARINEFSSARLCQKNGLWTVSGIPFYDGMKVDAMGNPIGAVDNSAEIEQRKKDLDKKVKKYIDGFAKDAVENGLNRPGPGDCLCCQFATRENQQPMGLEHIFSHLEECYYVSSLLMNAIKAKNYRDPVFIYQLIEADIRRGKADFLKRELSAYFRKLKPQLLKGIAS